MSLWPVVRVADLIEQGLIALNDGYRVTNLELGPTGIPFIRGGDIGDHGNINCQVDDHIRPEFTDRVRVKLAHPGDVAFITKGTVGRVGRLRPGQAPVVFAPQVAYWRSLAPDKVVPRFIYYLLSSTYFQSSLDAVKTHGSMAADYVSLSDQVAFRLPLPPHADQRAIAHILGSLDDKIDLNRRMNETFEALARAIFKSWFVDFDPVRAKMDGRKPVGMDAETAALFPSRMQESGVGEVPAGWTASGLDGVANFLNGLALQKYPPTDGVSLPVIKIAQLRARDTTGADRASNVPREYIVEDGDILFSWSGSLLVDVWCSGKGALNQHLFKVTSGRIPKWFFFHAVLEHLSRFQDIAADKATTMGHIQRRHLTEARIAVPPAKLVAAADKVFAPLLGRVVASRLESRTLASLRDTLLPKLLSGELRIPDAEKLVEAAT